VHSHEKKRREEESSFWTKFPTIPVNFSDKKVKYEFLTRQKKCMVVQRRMKNGQQIPSVFCSTSLLPCTYYILKLKTPK
jgi:hypothetical protein